MPPARKIPARKAPAKKAPARKTIAKKAPVRKAPAKKRGSMSLGKAKPAAPAAELDGMTHAQMALVERYAQEYIVDFHRVNAALRCGVSIEKAAAFATKCLYTPYCQSEILRLVRSMEESSIVGRNQVMAGLLREANREDIDASSSSRINAWTQLGKILGMYVQRVELNVKAGSVMEVPMVANAEEWERSAIEAQSELIEDARKE